MMVHVKLVGKGEVLGLEDVINDRNYTVNVRGVSQTCTVFKIEKNVILDAINRD